MCSTEYISYREYMILNLQAMSLTTHHVAVAPLGQGRGPLWKRRLAFQALFSREVLPQSLFDRRTVVEMDQQNMVSNSELDLNRMSQEPGPGESNSNGFVGLRGGVLGAGLGSVTLNHHHTKFQTLIRIIFSPEAACEVIEAELHSHVFFEEKPEHHHLMLDIVVIQATQTSSCQEIVVLFLCFRYGYVTPSEGVMARF
ncbi:hypothetical protein SSX86_030127 [Deinandra increscens subsp. villosa]|uniref:Uncharacterized protein n=1 Tax=Deinandra increscens subsp. villosa TaxID=3103831 RepID=A0AAP0CDU8_9ASTR